MVVICDSYFQFIQSSYDRSVSDDRRHCQTVLPAVTQNMQPNWESGTEPTQVPASNHWDSLHYGRSTKAPSPRHDYIVSPIIIIVIIIIIIIIM